MPSVDLNADLGESFGAWVLGDDAALLEVVTSANIACGFHAGDPGTMRRTCALAVAKDVRIGAQVGYRDLAGFGRRFLDLSREELVDDVLAQLGALDAFARVADGRVAYVKPHGALYHAVTTNEEQATALVEAITLFDAALPLVGLPGSRSLDLAADAGLATVREAFADRGYTPTGTLVPRRDAGAVLHDADVIATRSVRMVTEGLVTAIDGSDLPVQVDSLCVHGDTPGAVAIARAVRAALQSAGVSVTAG